MQIKNVAVSLMAASLLVLAACAGQKGPATAAVQAAESALAAVKDEAAKYAPTDLQGVETTLANLKGSLEKGDYKAVVDGAPALTSAISSLKSAAEAKKSEVEAAMAAAKTDWTSLSTDVPNMVTAIQSRVDILSKAKSLPKGITKEAFESAKSGLDMLKSGAADATAAATSGDFTTAVAKAKELKAKGAEVLALLGMKAAG